jgi:hypothetical protein
MTWMCTCNLVDEPTPIYEMILLLCTVKLCNHPYAWNRWNGALGRVRCNNSMHAAGREHVSVGICSGASQHQCRNHALEAGRAYEPCSDFQRRFGSPGVHQLAIHELRTSVRIGTTVCLVRSAQEPITSPCCLNFRLFDQEERIPASCCAR